MTIGQMTDKQKSGLEALLDMGNMFDEMFSEYHAEAEKFWNSLTEDQKLQAFYWVTSRINHAELMNNSSYRTVLYEHFGFDPSSYMIGMESGYMSIHNALNDGEAMMEMQQAEQLVVRCDGEDVYVSEPGVEIEYDYNPYKDYNRKVAVINVTPVHKKVYNTLDL